MTVTRRIGAMTAPLLAVFLWMAASPPAGATTLRRMDFGQLVARAHRVVDARVVANNVYWDATGTRIYTDTVFEVLDEAKGKGPKQLTVTMLGGRIDPAEMTVDGTPVFAAGEEVVLFTSPRPDGKNNLVGFSQGVLRVHEDRVTGRKWAVSDIFSGVTYVDTTGGHPVPVAPVRSRAPLDVLMQNVRAMVQDGVGKGAGLSMQPETPQTAAPKGGRP